MLKERSKEGPMERSNDRWKEGRTKEGPMQNKLKEKKERREGGDSPSPSWKVGRTEGKEGRRWKRGKEGRKGRNELKA